MNGRRGTAPLGTSPEQFSEFLLKIVIDRH